MENYYEFDLNDTDSYSGQFEQGQLQGFGIFTRAKMYLYCGEFKESQFHGYGAFADLKENLLYLGQFQKSQKHGSGLLIKFKTQSEVIQLADAASNNQRQTFQKLVEFWVSRAKSACDQAQSKSDKLRKLFTDSDLKDILKRITLTSSEHLQKHQKHQTKTQPTIVNYYLGPFEEDRRHGWGVCIQKNGDKYSGLFANDKMDGRGKYWFFNSTSVLYVGEIQQNIFQGLGKMVFLDGTQYFGSFVNNAMSSNKALIHFPNGDKFKGRIDRGQRNGPGEFFQQGMHYQGTFREDLRDGTCVVTFKTDQGVVKYKGDYLNDKRHGKCDELSLVTEDQQITFRGRMDDQQEWHGQGQVEFQRDHVFYKGEFKNSLMNGRGMMVHTDTKSTFDGEFLDQYKHGKAEFILQDGNKFCGVYNYGVLKEGARNSYGKRF